MSDCDPGDSARKFRHPNVEARALTRATRTEGKGYVLYEYPDYETYRLVQTKGNKAKLTWQSVQESHVVLLARWLDEQYGRVEFGLCHGTRRGAEQQWFSAHPAGHPAVIGTEISDTADQFPNTVQWGFHDENPDWAERADSIYSNFGITFEGLQELLTDTFQDRATLLPALDFRETNPEYKTRVVLLRKAA